MKIIKIFVLLNLSAITLFAQDVIVTSVEVDKGYPIIESSQSFYFKLAILTDVSKFTLNLEPEKTRFTKIIDDQGFDLLAAQQKFEVKNKTKGYQVQALEIRYNSPINSYETPGIFVESRLGVTPSKGAKSVHVEGVVAMINIADGEKKYIVKNVPTKFDWGSPGISTEFGNLIISNNGSSTADGVRFNILWVQAMQPIVSVTVIGGDDSKEAKEKSGMGVGGDQIIFKTIPETVDLEIVVSASEVVEIPFSLIIALGL